MRIHHVAFRTSDVAGLERFYSNLIGLSVLRRDGERSVWLDASGTILMIERREAGSEPSVDPATKELVCFAIEPTEHARFAAKLAAAGVPIEARTAFTIYFRDPDGRRVGLSSYPDEPR